MKRKNPEVSTPVIVAVSLAAGGAIAWWWMNRSVAQTTQAVTTAAVRSFIDPVTGRIGTSQAIGPIYGCIPGLPEGASEALAAAQQAAGRPLTRDEQTAVLARVGA